MGTGLANRNAVNAFSREFDACLTCLEETIAVLSDEDWVQGETNRQKPVHQACHCLGPVISYADIPIDCSHIYFRFKDPSSYPSRQEVLAIIKTIRSGLKDYITGVVDRTLVAKELHVPPLFKMIYLLRHTIVHLCCLREEAVRRGYRLPIYSKSYRPSGGRKSDRT